MAITKFNTSFPAKVNNGGSGFGTVLIVLALGALAYFGIKHFSKPDEEKK